MLAALTLGVEGEERLALSSDAASLDGGVSPIARLLCVCQAFPCRFWTQRGLLKGERSSFMLLTRLFLSAFVSSPTFFQF